MKPPNKIRERREELGLTQTEVADSVGTSQQTFRRYETGEVEPTVSKALLIADALDSSLDKLWPDDKKKRPKRKAKKK